MCSCFTFLSVVKFTKLKNNRVRETFIISTLSLHNLFTFITYKVYIMKWFLLLYFSLQYNAMRNNIIFNIIFCIIVLYIRL